MLLRKEIKDSLTRQGIQDVKCLHKRTGKKEKEERIILLRARQNFLASDEVRLKRLFSTTISTGSTVLQPQKYGFTERAFSPCDKQALTVKKNMHLILHSSTRALIAVAISTVPDGHPPWRIPLRELAQTKPAHIPHSILREVKVQIARWHRRGIPIPHTSA